MEPRPIEQPRGAGSLLPLAIFLFTTQAANYGFFSFAPWLLNEHVSEGQVTLVLLFQPAIIMLFSAIFGRISDKNQDRKKLVSLGFVAHMSVYLGIQVLVWLHAESLGWFIALYAVRGLAIAMISCEVAWFTDHTYQHGKTGAKNGKKHTGISYFFFLISIAWAAGSVVSGSLVEVFGPENIGIISFLIAALGIIPLARARDRYAMERPREGGKPATSFSITRDLKALDQGVLVYVSICLRHFGLITALAIIAIVLQDVGMPASVSGTVIALNPLFQIVGMTLATTAIVKGARPLRLFSGGLFCSTMVVFFYTLGVAFTSGLLVAIGQSTIGFAWPLMIIGFEEHVTRNVDWFKRANYTSLRETFMNLGKVAGMFMYYTSFEMLAFSRLELFAFLVLFPLSGLVLSLVANVRSKKPPPANIIHVSK